MKKLLDSTSLVTTASSTTTSTSGSNYSTSSRLLQVVTYYKYNGITEVPQLIT